MGKKDKNGNSNFAECVNNAINGIFEAFMSEKNLRIHFTIGVAVIILSFVLGISKLEMIAVMFSAALVISIEMVNTAIEKAVDLFTAEYSELARFVKDVAAGAVLIASLNAAAVGFIVFSKYLVDKPYNLITRISGTETEAIVITLIIIVAAVFGIKVAVGKGSYVRGGFPSGHSAIAFSLATVITMSNEKTLVALLAYALALIISESRVSSGIHSRLETLAGALLGVALTVLLFNIFRT